MLTNDIGERKRVILRLNLFPRHSVWMPSNEKMAAAELYSPKVF